MLLSITKGNLEEPLVKHSRFEMDEEVNGAFTVRLTSFKDVNNPGHDLIEEESVIHIEGYDFRIKQIREVRGAKEVVAISTFYDTVGIWKDEIFGGTRSLDDLATFILGDTGWTFSNIDVTGTQFVPNFGVNNVIKLIQMMCKIFDCEFKISSNKHIIFAKKIGPDNEAQYRYGHNVSTISRSVDTTNLRTRIKGYGAEGLEVTYTSQNAEKYGKIDAEPFEDEEYRTAEDLTARLKTELMDYPEVSIEVESVELSDKEVGERVWLIYEPMDIEFQTRITSKKSTIRNNKLVTQSVVIGNAVPRSLADVVADAKVEIDENRTYTRSRIEQTNERITLAVERFTGDMLEAYSKIELTADEIRAEVAANNVILEDGIAQNKSLISQTATQIRSEVTQEVKRVDGRIDTANSSITQTASSIRSEVKTSVTRLDGRIDSANTSITQLSGTISLKADSSTVSALTNRVASAEISINGVKGEINLKVNKDGVISAINLSSEWATINARKINLVGSVSVLSDITGNLGSIHAGTINGINIYSANINISDDVQIGNNLYLGSSWASGTKQIIFNSSSRISGDNGGMYISADTIYFSGSVADFSGVNRVDGLGGSSSTTVRYSPSSRRLYVDLYGSQQGWINLDG